jgi:hypothetical protein
LGRHPLSWPKFAYITPQQDLALPDEHKNPQMGGGVSSDFSELP